MGCLSFLHKQHFWTKEHLSLYLVAWDPISKWEYWQFSRGCNLKWQFWQFRRGCMMSLCGLLRRGLSRGRSPSLRSSFTWLSLHQYHHWTNTIIEYQWPSYNTNTIIGPIPSNQDADHVRHQNHEQQNHHQWAHVNHYHPDHPRHHHQGGIQDDYDPGWWSIHLDVRLATPSARKVSRGLRLTGSSRRRWRLSLI